MIDAELLYEQAIKSAQESGFIHIEALANELASRFYAARGLAKIARVWARGKERNAHLYAPKGGPDREAMFAAVGVSATADIERMRSSLP